MPAAAGSVAISCLLLVTFHLAPVFGQDADDPFSGRWFWQGPAGWQRIVLDLEADGEDLSGQMIMGPGTSELVDLPDYWEYFLDPVAFRIEKGRIEGLTIRFEHSAGPGGRLRYEGTVDHDRLTLVRVSDADPDEPAASRIRIELGRAFVPSSLPAGASNGATGDLFSLDFAAFDADGNPVTDLASDDFVLLLDGEPLPIVSLRAPEGPRHLLFLLDRSLVGLRGPNYALSRWSSFSAMLRRLAGGLGGGDRISVAFFDTRVELRLDRLPAGDRSQREIDSLDPEPALAGSPKDLYAALEWAMDRMEDWKGPKGVVLFTDAYDVRSSPRWLSNGVEEVFDPLFGLSDAAQEAAFEDLLGSVAGSTVPFFVMMFDPLAGVSPVVSGLFPDPEEVLGAYFETVRRRIVRLARVSGGTAIFDSALSPVIEGFMARLLATNVLYTIRFEAAGDVVLERIQLRARDPALRVRYAGSGP